MQVFWNRQWRSAYCRALYSYNSQWQSAHRRCKNIGRGIREVKMCAKWEKKIQFRQFCNTLIYFENILSVHTVSTTPAVWTPPTPICSDEWGNNVIIYVKCSVSNANKSFWKLMQYKISHLVKPCHSCDSVSTIKIWQYCSCWSHHSKYSCWKIRS